jgi:type IV secretory pathway TrbD component
MTPRKYLRVMIAMRAFVMVAGLVLAVFALIGGVWQLAIVGAVVALMTLPFLLYRLSILRKADPAFLDREADPAHKTVSPFRFRAKD